MRNRVRITHDNQLVAAVGGLIRRMDVRKGIGDIAAALVKALTADGCIIDKRIDFQNDRLVLPGQLGENQRAQTVTAKRRFDAEMLDIDVCAEIPIAKQARKRAALRALREQERGER